MQNYWNLYLARKQQQLYGPVNYRDFRETGPKSFSLFATCPFVQIAIFAVPFCVMNLCVLPFCVMPLCVLPLCVMPFCVMPFRVFPLCVMPPCVMPLCVLPFSAWYLYDSGFFSISSFYRGLFFFTNFDSVYFRFDLTLFTFRLLNFVIDIPS